MADSSKVALLCRVFHLQMTTFACIAMALWLAFTPMAMAASWWKPGLIKPLTPHGGHPAVAGPLRLLASFYGCFGLTVYMLRDFVIDDRRVGRPVNIAILLLSLTHIASAYSAHAWEYAQPDYVHIVMAAAGFSGAGALAQVVWAPPRRLRNDDDRAPAAPAGKGHKAD